jgi:hypothetical protein
MHGHGQSPAGPHGRALVDLSGESFAWLRATVSEAADRVFALEQSLKVHVSNASIPRGKLREAVRQQLETTDAIQQDITVPNWWSPTTDTDLDQIAPEMRHELQTAEGQDLLLGFSRGIVRAHARRPAPAPVLLQDADHWVRWNALLHASTPGTALERLAGATASSALEHEMLHGMIVHHPNTPPAVRDDLRRHGACQCPGFCPGRSAYLPRVAQ